MRNSRKYRIYIVGGIPETITAKTIQKFFNAEKELEKYNVEIINPIRNLIDKNYHIESAHKENLSALLNANAIYILNEPNEIIKETPELKISILLNLVIIHQGINIINENKKNKL